MLALIRRVSLRVSIRLGDCGSRVVVVVLRWKEGGWLFLFFFFSCYGFDMLHEA